MKSKDVINESEAYSSIMARCRDIINKSVSKAKGVRHREVPGSDVWRLSQELAAQPSGTPHGHVAYQQWQANPPETHLLDGTTLVRDRAQV